MCLLGLDALLRRLSLQTLQVGVSFRMPALPSLPWLNACRRISAWGMQALGHFQRRAQQPTVSELAAAEQALLSTAAAGEARAACAARIVLYSSSRASPFVPNPPDSVPNSSPAASPVDLLVKQEAGGQPSSNPWSCLQNWKTRCTAGAPLEDLLLWLATYDDPFTRRCAASGTLLAADAASLHCFPPLVRPFGLTRQQLVAAARDSGSAGSAGGGGGARSAYHPHAAPLAVLHPE